MSNPCILMVDDDENDIYLFKLIYNKANISNPIQYAMDGQEAINYLGGVGPFANRSQYPQPSVVLLDLNMPGRSGFEVLSWIREQPRLKGLVVVIFTSSYYSKDIEKSYLLGANSYIVKPSNTESLLEFIRLLKGWWLTFNQFLPSDVDSETSLKKGVK